MSKTKVEGHYTSNPPLYFIKGDSKYTGIEIIQALIDKGGKNLTNLDGKSHCYYFIGKDNIIRQAWSKELIELLELYGTELTFEPIPEFSTFDKVLVRNSTSRPWKAGIFSFYFVGSEYPYGLLDDKSYKYCIPYNKDTQYLNNQIGLYNVVK